MSRETFYTLRYGEFWEAMAMYRMEKEADRRHIGELVRGATIRLFNLQVQKEHKFKDPSKFWPMPWDPVNEAEEVARTFSRLTPEELDRKAREFLATLENKESDGSAGNIQA